MAGYPFIYTWWLALYLVLRSEFVDAGAEEPSEETPDAATEPAPYGEVQ